MALMGTLNETPGVATECLFVDPIADVAILGEPDSQELEKQHDQYEELVGSMTTVPIARATDGQSAFVFSLDGNWERCEVRCLPCQLHLMNPGRKVESGMSGSPIMTDKGEAISLASTGDYFNPLFAQNLTHWVFDGSGATKN